jgi:hypothetical protein
MHENSSCVLMPIVLLLGICSPLSYLLAMLSLVECDFWEYTGIMFGLTIPKIYKTL